VRRGPFPPDGRTLRAIGFDDAPFDRPSSGAEAREGARGRDVSLAGVVCAGTRFEGLVWGRVRRDGWNATEEVVRLLAGGKFLPQIHLVLLDGIAFGGFNVVDLAALADALARPCAAVMRRPPDLDAVERAIRRLPRPERRLELLRRAGPVHHAEGFVFQVCGAGADETGRVLARLTDRGAVPEPLRLAHLVAGAVRRGESGRRA
jgi:endonuclease V-like protein UPF0215 family